MCWLCFFFLHRLDLNAFSKFRYSLQWPPMKSAEKIRFKGIVETIWSDPSFIEWHVWFTTVPFKPFTDQWYRNYPLIAACFSLTLFKLQKHYIYIILNPLWTFPVQYWNHIVRIRFCGSLNSIWEINAWSFQASILSQLFKGFRCKSGIVLFAWIFTWNYAHTPFNSTSTHFINPGILPY